MFHTSVTGIPRVRVRSGMIYDEPAKLRHRTCAGRVMLTRPKRFTYVSDLPGCSEANLKRCNGVTNPVARSMSSPDDPVKVFGFLLPLYLAIPPP